MQFIGYLVRNSKKKKIDLSISYRCNQHKSLNVLFGNQLNTKQIITKLNNISIDIDDGMVNSTMFLADKLLQFDHRLNCLKMSGMIIKNGLDLDLLYKKFKVLFRRSNTTRLVFSDYYHHDALRMAMSDPSFLCWVQKLVQISPDKVFVDFISRI